MEIPQLPPGAPQWLTVQWQAQLQAFYQAAGNSVEQAKCVQAMQGMVSTARQLVQSTPPPPPVLSQLAQQLRVMLQPLQQFIRPAFAAAGMSFAYAGLVAGEVGTFIAGVGSSVMGFLLSPMFLWFLLAVLILVLLWWAQEHWWRPWMQRKELERMQKMRGAVLSPEQRQAAELLAKRKSAEMLAAFKAGVNAPRGLVETIKQHGKMAIA